MELLYNLAAHFLVVFFLQSNCSNCQWYFEIQWLIYSFTVIEIEICDAFVDDFFGFALIPAF